MNSIRKKNREDTEDSTPNARVRKGSNDDIVKVCPVCFFPVKIESSFYILYHFTCSNENCNWQGPTPIEVNLEDYKKFIEEKLANQKSTEVDN